MGLGSTRRDAQHGDLDRSVPTTTQRPRSYCPCSTGRNAGRSRGDQPAVWAARSAGAVSNAAATGGRAALITAATPTGHAPRGARGGSRATPACVSHQQPDAARPTVVLDVLSRLYQHGNRCGWERREAQQHCEQQPPQPGRHGAHARLGLGVKHGGQRSHAAVAADGQPPVGAGRLQPTESPISRVVQAA